MLDPASVGAAVSLCKSIPGSAAQRAEAAQAAAESAAEAAASSAAGVEYPVSYASQSLTDAQKAQARTNIAAPSSADMLFADGGVFSGDEMSIYATSNGYRLNESDGFCSSASGYKIIKFQVASVSAVKIVSDDRFQFQTGSTVNTSGTNYRIGATYGAGEFYLSVPATATYLIMSTPTSSSAHVYAVHSATDKLEVLRPIPVTDILEGQFEKGGINESGQPADYAAAARMRSKDYLVADCDIRLVYDNSSYTGGGIYLHRYSKTLTWLSAEGWSANVVIPKGTIFKLLVTRNADSTASVTISTLFGMLTSYSSHTIQDVDSITEGLFEKGNISSSGNNSDYAKVARIRTTNVLRATRRILVHVDNSSYTNASMYIYHHDKYGKFLSAFGWNTSVTINPGDCFRLMITLNKNAESTTYSIATTLANTVIDNTVGPNDLPIMVSHRGNTDGQSNHCKLSGYKKAIENGFTAVETDVRFTSDNVPVLCHDSTFTDATSGDTITIAETTYEALRECDFYGEQIASLEELLALCKQKGVTIFLDQLITMWKTVHEEAVFSLIRKYGMYDHIWYNIENVITANHILNYTVRPKFMFMVEWGVHTVTDVLAAADDYEDSADIGIMLYNYFTEQEFDDAVQAMPPTYKVCLYPGDTPSDKRTFGKYCDFCITNNDVAQFNT